MISRLSIRPTAPGRTGAERQIFGRIRPVVAGNGRILPVWPNLAGTSAERQNIRLKALFGGWPNEAQIPDLRTLMISRFLTPELARHLVNSVDVFLFDCDGVIWQGETLIEGVTSTMEMLRSRGKKVVFVTNNSTRSRKQYVKKFRALGLEVDHEEIFSSSFAAAFYLKSTNFDPHKKVYVIGEEGIRDELSHVGITSLGGPEDGEKRVQLSKDLFFEHDEKVGAVVVGLDRSINFYKMQNSVIDASI